MRVLVACEFSGTVRDAFLARGHDAWSCDLLPDERGSNRHITGDARDLLKPGLWDLLIVAHPPCTRLCNSGVRWLKRGPDLLPRRPWTDADNDQLRALMAEGLSRRDVAAAAGRSENAVRMQCRKLKLRFCPVRARERSQAAMAGVWQSPDYRAKIGAAVAASWTPDRREAARARFTRLRIWEAGHAVLAAEGEPRKRQQRAAAAAMRALRRQALAWCPLEYRADYRWLRVTKRFCAAEARALIEEQMARDLKRYAATGRLPQSERLEGGKAC